MIRQFYKVMNYMEKLTANNCCLSLHMRECLMKLLSSGLKNKKETTTTLSYKAQCQRYCEIQSGNGFKEQSDIQLLYIHQRT